MTNYFQINRLDFIGRPSRTRMCALIAGAFLPANKMQPVYMKNATQHKKHIKGFTLLEIIIALFIFTIISIIMTQSLHTLFQNQSVTEQHAKNLSELQMATLLISRDLEQAIDRPITNRERTQEPAFIGTQNRITFTHGGVANPAGDLPRSTLQRVTYFFDNNTLVRGTWNVLDQVATTTEDNRDILHDLNTLQVAYLDKKNHYNNQWPPANQPKAPVFPVAVKVFLDRGKQGTLTQVYVIPGHNFVTPLS